MRQAVVFSLFLFFSLNVFSQEGVSLGVLGGTAHYMGDFNKTNPFYSPSIGYGLMAKFDANKRYSVKFAMIKQSLKGSMKDFEDFNYPKAPGGLITKERFKSTFWDISATLEFNFIPYDVFNPRKENLTPFVFLGFGTDFFMSDENFNFPLTIPFGLGIKYNIFERFSIGFEWNFRKVFFDSMDGVNTIKGNTSTIHNDDWYQMGFLFISYKPFSRQIKCPAYED